jgi:purine-binding chemotaxis protein CheW
MQDSLHEDPESAIQRDEQVVQLVVIVLAEKYYAFYGESIKEIVPLSEITYVPGMPTYILGVMNVRGEIESVLDVKKLLGLPDTPITRQSRITIGEVHKVRSGLLVDSVEDVLEMPEDQISKPASRADVTWADYRVGKAHYKGDPLVILDIAKIFENLLCD